MRGYFNWLHGQWPAGGVEKLPASSEDGATNVPGLYVAGDLRGTPLLKLAADSGARVVRTIHSDPAFARGHDAAADPSLLDLAIIGAGVAGMSAALEARRLGLSFQIFEAAEPFSVIVNFPKAKPIYAYPPDMVPAGELKVSAQVKEDLVEELRAQTLGAGIRPEAARVERVRRGDGCLELVVPGRGPVRARRVLAALGRSGNFRRIDAPGRDLDKVYNRLHDPADFSGQDVLVVGGGDSALESAVALAQGGARVVLAHRGADFARAKAENVEKVRALVADPSAPVSVDRPVSERVTTASGPFTGRGRGPGGLRLLLSTRVQEIRLREVVVRGSGGREQTLPNDAVFSMIGREAPLDFFRRSGVRIVGEWTPSAKAAAIGFVAFCAALYDWKSGGLLAALFYKRGWFPVSLTRLLAGWIERPESPLGVLAVSASSPSFYYTLAYSLLVLIFGVRRIRRRRTPYVTAQTLSLMAFQIFPLFLLPELLLPWMGENGWISQKVLDALFPAATYGHGREYWRAYGFVLAWPLMIYNVFTDQPLGWWLAISFAQTFVLIPALVYFWGKGAYCGWICSCGALAETLGDDHRAKMPHGPGWNRLNAAGQWILALCLLMLAWRLLGWIWPAAAFPFNAVKAGYKWTVDVFLAGVVGYGLYFWYSGRVWCRFFCPLAALMNVYARFSRFRILADKKKCISCNLCTSVCHQGIDVMNFANKGLAMRDPQCVRCSACVQTCPTGVLSFGQADRAGKVIKIDALRAVSLKSQ